MVFDQKDQKEQQRSPISKSNQDELRLLGEALRFFRSIPETPGKHFPSLKQIIMAQSKQYPDTIIRLHLFFWYFLYQYQSEFTAAEVLGLIEAVIRLHIADFSLLAFSVKEDDKDCRQPLLENLVTALKTGHDELFSRLLEKTNDYLFPDG